jgi:integrase/recombinase XerD
MNHLHVHLANYLKLRRGLGFKLVSAAMQLRGFVRFAETKPAQFITTKLALEWATQGSNANRNQNGSRLATVRRFAEYLRTIDPRTEVPSPKLLPYHIRRRPPHLYRNEDVRKLVEAAYKIAPAHPIKGLTLGTLLGLLATTGMRVSEALKLDRGDVDWDREQLTIRLAKGNRTRLTPLHPSTVAALRRYASIRDTISPKRRTPAFFVWDGGLRLGYDTVHRWFLLVACQTGLRRPGDPHGPRVHDLRHHFAIQTMLQWYRTDVDVEARLPELSTYLGHVHVRDTYWYLSAVPELLQLATQRLRPKEVGR